MDQIVAKHISFTYECENRKKKNIDDITLTIRKGELVSIVGHNGSGKTTLARHFNVLLPVQSGQLTVASLDAKLSKNIWKIRKNCGMVFQNPDNQFVSSEVEEDIAFGLRNYDVDEKEIPRIVSESLDQVGMHGYEKHSPHLLSGGQKQRIAIAGILALNPDILILDEVTAMLDPEGREEVLDIVKKLHQQGKTIIMISHYIEETVFSDRVMLMHQGKILCEGAPREVLTDLTGLTKAGITPPVPVRLYYDLKKAGIQIGPCPLTNEELVEELCQLL